MMEGSLAGVVAALVAQLTKAEGWSRWVKALYGVAAATGASLVVGGGFDQQALLTTVSVALATHSFLLADTPLGRALKWNILGRLADTVMAIFPSKEGG